MCIDLMLNCSLNCNCKPKGNATDFLDQFKLTTSIVIVIVIPNIFTSHHTKYHKHILCNIKLRAPQITYLNICIDRVYFSEHI